MKGYKEVELMHCDRFFDQVPAGVVPIAVEVRARAGRQRPWGAMDKRLIHHPRKLEQLRSTRKLGGCLLHRRIILFPASDEIRNQAQACFEQLQLPGQRRP